MSLDFQEHDIVVNVTWHALKVDSSHPSSIPWWTAIALFGPPVSFIQLLRSRKKCTESGQIHCKSYVIYAQFNQ